MREAVEVEVAIEGLVEQVELLAVVAALVRREEVVVVVLGERRIANGSKKEEVDEKLIQHCPAAASFR